MSLLKSLVAWRVISLIKNSSTQEAKNGALRNSARDCWVFLTP
jgi:hypothetical protein